MSYLDHGRPQRQAPHLEQWRRVPGYEGLYEISNRGAVRRVAGRYLKPNVGKGEVKINLYRDGEITAHLIDDLLTAAGFAPVGEQARASRSDVDLDDRLDRAEQLAAESM